MLSALLPEQPRPFYPPPVWMALSSQDASPPSAQPASDREDEPISLAEKRVVIVEDEGITQMQLHRMLTRAQLRIVGIATNGQDGVKTVLREQPDLVLMDINMPIMDGLEATRRILAEYPTCVVMLTAYSDFQEQARQLGACGYVLKPISSETLLPYLQEALQSFYEH